MEALLAGLFVGGGIIAVLAIFVLVTLLRTAFASLLVWLGWTVLVWTEVLAVEPSFWPVVGIGFCLALVTGMVSGSSSNSD